MRSLVLCALLVGVPSLEGRAADAGQAPPSGPGREVSVPGMRAVIDVRGAVLTATVQLDGAGISSLVLGSGDRVWVLHASAALGTGEYRCPAEGPCRRVRDFDYRCRDPSSSPEAERCRREFRAADGWVANVDPRGTLTRTFQVDLPRFGAGGAPVFLAVTGLTFPDRPARWPAGDDDAGALSLQQGMLAERARFSPRSWSAVRR